MSGPIADFAVIGSTPLARFLAGLLASVHGKTVIHVGESQSGYRLPRGIDLSVAPITRPETWSLLRAGLSETQKLVGRFAGRRSWKYVNPIFIAHGEMAIEALSHIRHMALGFGVAAETTAPSMLGKDRAGLILRDAVLFNRAEFEPALDNWLARLGVRQIANPTVSIQPDGSARLAVEGTHVEARQAVLADDNAILAHLPLPQWPMLLRRQVMSTILTTPTRLAIGPVMLDIATETLLLQQAEDGVAGIGPGDLATFSAHMQKLLGADRPLEQAGQTSFTLLRTADAAPAVGRAAGVGADVIAGLGPTGLFMVPALARWIVGAARPVEADWFGARLVNRTGSERPVGDYSGLRGGAQ